MKPSVVDKAGHAKSYLFWKRVFDVCFAILALVVLWPLLAIICLVIKAESSGPAIYVHSRIGRNGKPFPLYKFRTMCNDAESMIQDFTPEQKQEWQQSYKLACDPRVTRVGSFLRSSSLDELPQLLNILRGELSFVGPRPITEEELERYGDNRSSFLSVTPGLTGYWQAYARNTCTYEKRMEMELYYVEHAGFWLDVRIFFATIGMVLSRKGAM